ncbi:MAG TPA: TAT-variant-translocated molybdopterin oxidoreductase, partial [Thermoanaerobaculia bacterium]
MAEEKNLTYSEFRQRIGDTGNREYWRSLEELTRSDVFDDFMRDEFPQQAIALDKGVDRRDFMKLMGASVAMAGLAACNQPSEQIVPYVNQPENLIPGKPIFFASAMTLGGYARGVLVESHMGRPTKVEGNPDHPSSLGATDSFMQAAILGLYDPERSQVVRRLGEISTWSEFIAALQTPLTAAKTNGAGLRLLTQTITSPTLGSQIQQVLAQYPGAKWHQWEPAGGDNAREGARLAFGDYVNPVYHFDKANVVVSLGSDFLGEGPAHLRYARDFMSRRKVRRGTTSMNRLYVIESMPTQTGGVADHRFAVKPSEIEGIARAILNGGQAWLAIAKDLQANRGATIVIAGDEQPPVVHAIAHAINQALGSHGSTITITDPVEVAPVNQLESLRQLVVDMNAGRVNALIILGGNPVFDAPSDFNFRAALDKVPFRAHLSPYYDDTSMHVHWHVPETHSLETWSDARAHDGTVSIMQPLIAPLYNGRSPHEVLGALLGGLDQSPYETVRSYWFGKGANENTWRKWLNDGVIAGSALPARGGAASTAAPTTGNRQPTTGIEIELKPDPTIHDGRFANNAWLQELPKPITKITWENVVLVGVQTARQIGLSDEDRDFLVNERRTRLVDVDYRGIKQRMPLWVVPGHTEGVATIFFGYGREHGGAVATEKGRGFNTYPFRFSDAMHGGGGARIVMTSQPPYPIACTQEHQSLDPSLVGERGIMRTASFEEYQKNPAFAQEKHEGG